MVDESFNFHLENLKKLQIDLEKQMLRFDEIIPYERQETARIYSPRLLNMMLACCPQIEAVTNLISTKCNFSGNGIPTLIGKINKKAVLSNFQIISIPHKLLFTPFPKELSWWQAYNKLKHELTGKQFKLTYTIVMDAFAALAGLHCLSEKLVSCSDDRVPITLDRKNWTNDYEDMKTIVMARGKKDPYPTYKSLMFEVKTVLSN